MRIWSYLKMLISAIEALKYYYYYVVNAMYSDLEDRKHVAKRKQTKPKQC